MYSKTGENVTVTDRSVGLVPKSFQMAWSISALHSVGALHGPVGFHKFYSTYPCGEFILGLFTYCVQTDEAETAA